MRRCTDIASAGRVGWQCLLLILIAAGAVGALESQNIEFIGCLPGVVNEVQVVGDLAYCAAGSGLMILDVADGAVPRQLGFFPLPDYASNVFVTGQYAYVCDEDAGLRIVDVQDPSAPFEVSYINTPDQVLDVQVHDGIAYLVDHDTGLRIVDVSDPAAPVHLGTCDPYATYEGLDVEGDIVYLAAYFGGVRIIDASDLNNPVEIAVFDRVCGSKDVAVADGYAYVPCSSDLYVVDVSNPALPVQVGFYEHASWDSSQDIELEGSYAYVSHLGDGVCIIDVSDPIAPAFAGFHETYGYSFGLDVQGGIVYAAACFGGLYIIDATVPNSTVLLSHYGLLGYANDVLVDGSRVFVTGGYGEVDEGSTPGKTRTPAECNDPQRPQARTGVFTLALDDPAFPRLLGLGNTSTLAHGLDVVGDYAYVTDHYGGFWIIDVSNLAAPTPVGSIVPPGAAIEVAVIGNHAYVACLENGIRIIDVSDVNHPVEIGHVDTPEEVYDVATNGKLLYAIDYYAGLYVIDISNPAEPQIIGQFATPGYAFGIEVCDDLAYIANSGAGLTIVDVSDPAAPTLVCTHDTPSFAFALAVDGDYAYVADYSGGLRVVDVGNPAFPFEVGYYITPHSTGQIAVYGEYILVLDDYGGLFVLRGDFTVSADEDETIRQSVGTYALRQNHPNPFNPATTIRYELPQASRVVLQIFDAAGRLVRTMVDGDLQDAGQHEIGWDGCDGMGRPVAAGVFLYQLEADSFREVRPMVLVRFYSSILAPSSMGLHPDSGW